MPNNLFSIFLVIASLWKVEVMSHDFNRGRILNIRGGDLSATHVIGIRGGIASGKSSVARRLRSHGAEVIDADRFHLLSRFIH